MQIHQDEILTGEAVALDVQPVGFFLRALGTLIQVDGAFRVKNAEVMAISPPPQDPEMALKLRPEFRAIELTARAAIATTQGTLWQSAAPGEVHEEVELLPLLRAGATDAQLAERWRAAMWAKPAAHGMDHVGLDSSDYVQPERSMSAIGG